MDDKIVEMSIKRVDKTIYTAAKIVQLLSVIMLVIIGIVAGILVSSAILAIVCCVGAAVEYLVLREVYDRIGIGPGHIYKDY